MANLAQVLLNSFNSRSINTITVAALVCLCAFNPCKGWSANADKPFIEVQGIAEEEVVPDEIYLTIVLTGTTGGRNTPAIKDQEVALMKIVRDQSIDPANLSLSDANEAYIRVNWLNKDVTAKKTYQLKVVSAQAASEVFHALENLHITTAFIARVDYSKREELKKDLRIRAIRAAKEKALYLTNAIGESIGEALSITESGSFPVYQANLFRATAMSTTSGDVAPDQDENIAFKEMKFSATVEVKFEIRLK